MKPTQVVQRPLLRYHGGKWRLAPWILQHIPPHRIYVEPYGGGASMLLRKPRSYAEVYNDLNEEVVNVFRTARDQGEELRRALYFTPFGRMEFENSYKPVPCNVEQARRTIVRSFMGFGSDSASSGIKSGFRANSNRSGTTPAHDWRNYADVFDFFIERLRGVVIENRDAIDCMKQHDREDVLIYADPPYVLSTRTSKKHGYKHEMDDEMHRDLAAYLATCKASVVLSGYNTDIYHDILWDWKCVERKAHADGARERTEVLWISPKAEKELEEAWLHE